MMLYEPDRKSDSLSLSTRSTATSMSTMPRYVLYDPEDPSLSSQRPHKSAPSNHRRPSHQHHHTHHIEVRENGAVVAHTTTSTTPGPLSFYGKHSLLEDPYDAQGLRQGAWEVGLCAPRACLPMVCCAPCLLPSVAIAQVRARLGLASYRAALVREWLRVVTLVALPIAVYVSLIKLQNAPEVPPDAPIDQQMVSTGWMVLLWTSFVAVVMVLLATALTLSELRLKIRARCQIPGSRARDLGAVVCLPACAVAQMSTHVRCLRPGRYRLARPETLPAYEY